MLHGRDAFDVVPQRRAKSVTTTRLARERRRYMSDYDRAKRGREFEGYAFTFCKAAFLVLIFQRYALFAISGLATLFYILAASLGVKQWRCWAKPPWVTIFWAGVCAWQAWALLFHR